MLSVDKYINCIFTRDGFFTCGNSFCSIIHHVFYCGGNIFCTLTFNLQSQVLRVGPIFENPL